MTRSIRKPGSWVARYKRVLAAPQPLPHSGTRPEVAPELASLAGESEEARHQLMLTPTIPDIKPWQP